MRERLFGSSGARGLVNVDLTPDLVSEIGLAVMTLSGTKKVLLARDTRVTGIMIENALISGLLGGGAEVICLGIAPTPVLAYLTKELKVDAGFMITASHNPSEYNGIKIFNRDSAAFNEEKQKAVETIVENKRFKLADWRGMGHVTYADKTQQYVEKIRESVRLRRKWHIIVDPGCGATSQLWSLLLRDSGCRTMAVNSQPDGYFPGRSPEPNAESLKPLAKIVEASSADGAIAYDGDGDRVAFIDEKGKFTDFDRVLAAYACYAVEKEDRDTVVTNVEASMCVERMVESHGGKIIRTRVGDVYLSEAIKRNRGVFGGEPCGAWIHPKYHYSPDGILSSLLLLKALEDRKVKLSEFVSEVPQYSTLRENVACKNELKNLIAEEIADRLKTAFKGHGAFSTVDGIRLVVEKGWILVRASGTEPLIRITVEGESLKVARQIMKEGTALVNELIEGTSK